MTNFAEGWAIVLAAGDGSRLASLSVDDDGNAVPKQYCSLHGGNTLLQDALLRAGKVMRRDRVGAIVAKQHGSHWRHALQALPTANIAVQPRNRGTAIGILLATLRVLERDPQARILFLPADHYVRDEAALAEALRRTVALLDHEHSPLVLLGIEPEEDDPELGYIVPGAFDPRGVPRVTRFVEKPRRAIARELLAEGALWNSFIFAAHAATLLRLINARLPDIVRAMQAALGLDAARGDRGEALAELYDRLPSVDFSREIVEGNESRFCVQTAPPCGWSDLGTPRRVFETLRRFDLLRAAAIEGERTIASPVALNLAARYARSTPLDERACLSLSSTHSGSTPLPLTHQGVI